MDPLHATIEELAADGFTHIEANRPRGRVIRLRTIDQLPKSRWGLRSMRWRAGCDVPSAVVGYCR